MTRKAVTTIALILAAIYCLITIHPAKPAPAIRTVPIATAQPTQPAPALPACENEDGSGQMLCAWDASESGNGEGTDVIAGDCSVDTVGSVEAMRLCTQLYVIDAYAYTDANGARIGVSDGKALVSECEDIAFEASINDKAANELKNEGWTIEECFKGFIKN